MRKHAILLPLALLAAPLLCGCGRSSENQVIEGSADPVTPAMIETEERELETTQ